MNEHEPCLALEKLREYMGKNALSARGLARLLGVTPMAVCAWMSGKARPKPHLRNAMHENANIAEHDWATEAEASELRAISERWELWVRD